MTAPTSSDNEQQSEQQPGQGGSGWPYTFGFTFDDCDDCQDSQRSGETAGRQEGGDN